MVSLRLPYINYGIFNIRTFKKYAIYCSVRGMGEKPSPLPACAEAPACALRAGKSAGRGEDFSLIVGVPKGFKDSRGQGFKEMLVGSLHLSE